MNDRQPCSESSKRVTHDISHLVKQAVKSLNICTSPPRRGPYPFNKIWSGPLWRQAGVRKTVICTKLIKANAFSKKLLKIKINELLLPSLSSRNFNTISNIPPAPLSNRVLIGRVSLLLSTLYFARLKPAIVMLGFSKIIKLNDRVESLRWVFLNSAVLLKPNGFLNKQ